LVPKVLLFCELAQVGGSSVIGPNASNKLSL
jgi:hypothetical protein